MPQPPNIPQIRLNTITTCLTAAVSTLEIVSDSMNTPYLKPISNKARSLVTAMQTIRQNKNECTQLMERIHELLYAIIGLHINSNTGGELSPSMLNQVAKFTETLNKVHAFVEAQQDKSRLRQFFRQAEMTALLKDCNAGLQEAIDIFKANIFWVLTLQNVDSCRNAQERHQEVLQLIESLSDGTASDTASSISRVISGSRNSSSSLSILPSEPKIFHGRESELADILKLFAEGTPRVAILGPGGMGKTSLTRATLHHPKITVRYEQLRFFVACDTMSTSVELAAHIGSQLGLKPGKDLTRAVVNHFSDNPACLLILDNMENIWEPVESRGAVEEFLSLLTGVKHLGLIITMRGAERPAKVKWTRPFLPPLKRLSQDAARQTFIKIADDVHDKEDIDKILYLTDNMPLAIGLVAHLTDSEGCPNVLSRWETEKTSLLSEGYDRRSNLDLSISLSLASSRIMSMPHSADLLSLLSMLPDGLSDAELLQSKLPIPNILECKAALLSTSLVYVNDHNRVKLLVPFREYMQKFQPPGTHLVQPLLTHFEELLEVQEMYHGTALTSGAVTRITSNFANIQNLLLDGLHKDNPNLLKTILCAIFFHRFTSRARRPSLDQISQVLPQPVDHRLELWVITEVFNSWMYCPLPDPGALIDQGLKHFKHVNDPITKYTFCCTLSIYYLNHSDFPMAVNFSQTALSLSRAKGDTRGQAVSLDLLGIVKCYMGDLLGAKIDLHESQKLARICGDRLAEARGLRHEAMCWSALGGYNSAIPLFKLGRELIGLCGLSGNMLDCSIMMEQAHLLKLKSEYVESRIIWQTQILRESNVGQDPVNHAIALVNIADIDVTIGAPTHDVQRNLSAAKLIFDSINFSKGLTWCDRILGNFHLREGNIVAARKLFQHCAKATGLRSVIYSLEKLADASHWTVMDWTSNWTIVFLVYSIKSQRKLEMYKAFLFLGDVFMADDKNIAISLFTLALEAFTHMDVHQSRAECMLRLGDIANFHEDMIKAAELWRTARPLFKRSSQGKRIDDIDTRIGSIPDSVTHVGNAQTGTRTSWWELQAPTTRPEGLSVNRNEGQSEVEKIENLVLDSEKELVVAAV
ncbi:hypothetical protein FB451DRAFT_1532790 [Mycena latifolia]|nr:hypothetical protein FB451DRAFT_1532790 [Mycena latifolia]